LKGEGEEKGKGKENLWKDSSIAGRGENWGGQRKGKGKRINWGAAKVQVREKIRKEGKNGTRKKKRPNGKMNGKKKKTENGIMKNSSGRRPKTGQTNTDE
jgi:hypothetical protein